MFLRAKSGAKQAALRFEGYAVAEVKEGTVTAGSAEVSSTNQMPCLFVTQRELQFGQNMCIVGSTESLGEWKEENAVEMTWAEGNIWSVVAFLPIGEESHFKFVVKRDGEFEWENSPDRLVTMCESPLIVGGNFGNNQLTVDSANIVDHELTVTGTQFESFQLAPYPLNGWMANEVEVEVKKEAEEEEQEVEVKDETEIAVSENKDDGTVALVEDILEESEEEEETEEEVAEESSTSSEEASEEDVVVEQPKAKSRGMSTRVEDTSSKQTTTYLVLLALLVMGGVVAADELGYLPEQVSFIQYASK